MDFWHILEILDRRKWLILLSVIVSLSLAFGATRLIGAKWSATVRLAAVTNDPLDQSNETDPTLQNRRTEALSALYTGLLKSKNVLGPALDKSHVDKSTFTGDQLRDIKLDVVGTNAYELVVMDPNPGQAERFANALAETLVSESSSIYTRQAQDVVDVLKQQMEKATSEMEKARQRYDSYRKQNHLLSTPSQGSNLALSEWVGLKRKRDDANEKLVEAMARLQKNQQQLAQIPQKIPVPRTPEADPLVQALEQQLAQAESQLTVLRSKYTDEKIEVKQGILTRDALASRLQAAKAKFNETTVYQPNPARSRYQEAIEQLQQEAQGYKAQIATLDRSVQTSEARVQRTMGSDSTLVELAANVAQRSEARSQLAARLQNAGMMLDVARGKKALVIVNRVSDLNPPVNVRSGRTKKLLLLAALCSLLAASGLVIAFDSFDKRLKTIQDADNVLPVPVCAAIPQPVGSITDKTLARITEYDPLALHSEAYHFLALSLLREKGKQVRSLMVVSAKSGQGSTNAIINLGISLAQAGKRVVIVDANIRSPGIHEVFQIDNDFGFTNLMEHLDSDRLERAMRSTTIPNLSIIPSGRTTENPWKIFRSENLMALSLRLKAVADYILYDTPSAVVFADALNLTPIIDAALLCVRAQQRLNGAEKQIITYLQEENITVLGSILTNLPSPLVEGSKEYQRYYPPALLAPSGALPSKGGGNTESMTQVETSIPLHPSNQVQVWTETEHVDVDPHGDHLNSDHVNGSEKNKSPDKNNLII